METDRMMLKKSKMSHMGDIIGKKITAIKSLLFDQLRLVGESL
jgi:hypothetical protein